jgi:molybdenum cofactor biosynthesis protein B
MGHEEHKHAAPKSVTAAILVVSDTRSEATDLSGKRIRELLEAHGHHVLSLDVVRDERVEIANWVNRTASRHEVDVLLLTGGTGISPRDVTIEAVTPLLHVHLPGFGELFRWLSFQEIGSAAMLSRASAGVVRGRYVACFCLPGSRPAIELAMEKLILPEIGHLIAEIRKGTPHGTH